MRIEETLLIYGAIGFAVAGALAWRDPRRTPLWLTIGLAFWPLFLPFLFSPPNKPPPIVAAAGTLRAEVDGLAPLPDELSDLPAAVDAVDRMREGVDDLSRVLTQHEAALAADEPTLSRSERTREVLESRRADLERLREARDEQEERTLRLTGQVREAITKAHLIRYGGATPEELQKLMTQMTDETTNVTGRFVAPGRRQM